MLSFFVSLLNKQLSVKHTDIGVQAYHEIHSLTRSESVLGCSNIPSMGWTVVSQILMVHLLNLSINCSISNAHRHSDRLALSAQ
jgi:hypothetical protein